MTDYFHLTRKREDTEWTVESRDGLIIKHYKVITLKGFLRARWRREHNALLRLAEHNVPAPKTHFVLANAKNVFTHQRESLPGFALTGWNSERAAELGHYIASVHRAAVTLGDMALDNFLITNTGRLVFIDYGRARVFLWRGFFFYIFASKDLLRTTQKLLANNPDLGAIFSENYRKALGFSSISMNLMRFFQRFW